MASDRDGNRDYNYAWNDAPSYRKPKRQMKSDPNFSQFLETIRHQDVVDIEARLKEALANGEFSMQDQHGNRIDPSDLDMDTFRVKFPEELTENSQLEMYVAAKDGREVGIGVKVGDVDEPELPEMSFEEMLEQVETMPPAEQADLVIDIVADAMMKGVEEELRTALNKARHDPELWDKLREKALLKLASKGLAPKRPLGPPGMRGFLWIAPIPEGPRLCPRCGETWIPINEAPGQYMGAMSRIRVGRGRPATDSTAEYASRSVEICSPCGQDEAMGRGLVPIEDWPIGKGDLYYDNRFFTDAMRDAIKSGRVKLQNQETGEIVHSDGSDVELVSVTGSEVKLKIGTEGTPVAGIWLDEDGNELDLTGKDN